MNKADLEEIREIVRKEARDARVDRTGLYVMVFFILIWLLTLGNEIDAIKDAIKPTPAAHSP
jgi:hypothetical protein